MSHQERIEKLLSELNNTNVLSALIRATKMQGALRVIHTWAAMDELVPEETQALCERALGVKERNANGAS